MDGLRYAIFVAFGGLACTAEPGTQDGGATFSGGPAGTTATSDTAETGMASTMAGTSAAQGTADGSSDGPIFDLGAGDRGLDLPSCDEAQWEFGTVAPNVLLVVDKSGSMTETWSDGGVTVQRWQSLQSVVDSIVANFDDRMNLGLQLYPEHPGGFGSCIVTAEPTVPIAPMSGAAIQSSLSTANVQGSTPLQGGIDSSIAHLDALYASDPATTPPQAMILIADGGISCDQSHIATRDAIATAASQDPNPIPTYVVGIDISAFDDDPMNEYAMAGGQPAPGPGNAFYDTQSGDELAAALELIAGQLQSCTVVLDPPPNPELLEFMELAVDGVEYPYVEDCADGDGWTFDGEAMDTVEFCGAACVALQDTGTVDATYGCPPSG